MNSPVEIPAGAADATVGSRPEKPAIVWSRRLIIAAFWAVVVFLGLPHWTWTTSVRRSNLPLDRMNAWAEGGACQLGFPLYIGLQSPDLAEQQTLGLASRFEAFLNNQQSSGLHRFHVVPQDQASTANASRIALTVRLRDATTAESPKAALHPWLSLLDAKYALTSSTDLDAVGMYLATQVSRLFEDEHASLEHSLRNTPFAGKTQTPTLQSEQVANLDKRTTRVFKYAPTYHLSFSLFTPGASPSAWDIDEALREYIAPLLAPLSSISEFTVDTQVQLYASFSPSIAGPVFNPEKNRWTLHYGDLTGFVNAAEWPLSPGIGTGPTINFVMYVPAPDQSPLMIDENDGTSWIIPQWGGVQILNLSGHNRTVATLEDLRPAMLSFGEQLTALLGLPETPTSLPLRISALTRERATSLIVSASSTLGALSRLTLKLTSIAIPDSVAKAVDETLFRLDQACSDLRKGHFQSALENARRAESEVEQAFFEPSMVGQVYFPDEHKVAVYVPLLGPMAVPLIMSGLKELKKWRERKLKTS